MATTYEALSYKLAPVFAAGFPGVIDRTSTIDVADTTGDDTYTFIINDVVKCFKMPQGAKILYGRLECDDLDDNVSPTLELDLIITDGTTTYTLISGASSTIAEAGGVADTRTSVTLADVIGKVLTNPNFYAAVKVRTAATGDPADDTAKIIVSVGYSLNVESDEYQRTFPTSNPTTVTVT